MPAFAAPAHLVSANSNPAPNGYQATQRRQVLVAEMGNPLASFELSAESRSKLQGLQTEITHTYGRAQGKIRRSALKGTLPLAPIGTDPSPMEFSFSAVLRQKELTVDSLTVNLAGVPLNDGVRLWRPEVEVFRVKADGSKGSAIVDAGKKSRVPLNPQSSLVHGRFSATSAVKTQLGEKDQLRFEIAFRAFRIDSHIRETDELTTPVAITLPYGEVATMQTANEGVFLNNQGSAVQVSACFLTTTVCDLLGRPDDGLELSTLRRFRNRYLQAQPEGQALLAEYDRVGPRLSTFLWHHPQSHSLARSIYWRYLVPCLALIALRAYRPAVAHYRSLVHWLIAQESSFR